MTQEIVKFYATDGITLDGYINKCENNTNKILIQTHGMTSNCFKYKANAISNEVLKNGIDSLCYNNRGSEIAKFIKGKDGVVRLGGSAYEEISESYYDICGAIQFALDRGYTDIYLQGHSLGSTKTVYAYNRLLKENNELASHVKALILLSLVDLPMVVKYYGKDYLEYAKEKMEKGEGNSMIAPDAFPYPLSVKVFLRYATNNGDIDFAKFGNEEDDFEVLNSFKIPLFFRWGNVEEILSLDVEKQVDFIKRKIHNDKLDASFIDGANHSYFGKEEQLAKEIAEFLNKNI
ncbi:MAG: hypothetical protein IKI57_07095 [Clostridia bacterium]|nr:hypothetical protein [Clostridia bacterium]